jgi:hypothetical protein
MRQRRTAFIENQPLFLLNNCLVHSYRLGTDVISDLSSYKGICSACNPWQALEMWKVPRDDIVKLQKLLKSLVCREWT